MKRSVSMALLLAWLLVPGLRGTDRFPPPGLAAERRPFLLLTNDDGVDSPGLKALREEMEKVGDVLVVAPAKNSSGGSQSVSLEKAIAVKTVPADPPTREGNALEDGKPARRPMYVVDGPPATCVLLAVEHLAEGRRFDLVLSGINTGENLGLDIPISGTVGAARMAADLGIPALALSLAYGSKEYRAAAELSAKVVREALKKDLSGGLVLNVNFPRTPPSDWKPLILAMPGGRGFELTHRRKEDAGGALVFEAHLDLYKGPLPEGSDSRALAEGHVTVTPLASGLREDARRLLEGWSIFRRN